MKQNYTSMDLDHTYVMAC